MTRYMILLLILIVGIPGIAQNSSNDEQVWYYAFPFEGDTNIITAFTLTGEVRLLDEVTLAKWATTSRVDRERVLFFSENPNSTFNLVLATPEKLYTLATGLDESYYHVDVYDNFIVMRSQLEDDKITALFVDLSTGIVTKRQVANFRSSICCVYDPSSTIIRYISYDETLDPDVIILELRSLYIETGEETVLYETTTSETHRVRFYPFSDGDSWLMETLSMNDQTFSSVSYEIIEGNGATKHLGDADTTDDGLFRFYRTFNDYIFSYYLGCYSQCQVELLDKDLQTIMSFDMESSFLNPMPVYLSEDSLIVLDTVRVIRLTVNDIAEDLGTHFNGNSLSQNKRWSVLRDKENSTDIIFWDHETNIPLHIQKLSNATDITILQEHLDKLTIFDLQQRQFAYFIDTENGTFVDWSRELSPSSIYIDFFVSESEVILNHFGSRVIDKGLYHYDRETRTMTQLLSGLHSLLE